MKNQTKANKTLQYRTVDTSTLSGLKAAEKLHTSGWKTICVGLFLITFEKRG